MLFFKKFFWTWKTVAEDPEIKVRRKRWSRLRQLAKFAALADKAREIELEWQRIQQDEFDALAAFQTNMREDDKQSYMYKKGVADGVKWCVNRFS